MVLNVCPCIYLSYVVFKFINIFTKKNWNIHKILHRLCGDKLIWIFFRLTWTGMIGGQHTTLCGFSPANKPENPGSHKCTEDYDTHNSSKNCPSIATFLCRETKRCEDWKSNFLRCLHKQLPITQYIYSV